MTRRRRLATLALALAALAPPAPAADGAVFKDCTIHADPRGEPLRNASLLVRDGEVAAVGRFDALPFPAGVVPVIDCDGGALVPGYWNAHGHFLGPDWRGEGEAVQGRLDRFFLRHGFTTVVDTGSELEHTLALRRAIAAGRLRGPRILASGLPLVAPGGTPYYVPDLRFPEVADPEAARAAVDRLRADGADLVKVMTVSLTAHPPFPELPPGVLGAITARAHGHGLRVAAHPTTARGVALAAEHGVDLLLHTTPATGPWDPALVQALVARRVALTPTLALWRYEAAKEGLHAQGEAWTAVAEGQLRDFAAAGGTVLFGTDAGYMTRDAPLPEFEAMARAGLDARAVLRALTTSPRLYFDGEQAAPLAVGQPADLLLLAADPDTAGVAALAAPRVVMRAGAFIIGGERASGD